MGTARHCCRDGMELAPSKLLLPSEAVGVTLCGVGTTVFTEGRQDALYMTAASEPPSAPVSSL